MEAFFVYLCRNISKPIMSVTSFIGKVNQLALAGTPFFFIIDFEKKSPLSILSKTLQKKTFYLISVDFVITANKS